MRSENEIRGRLGKFLEIVLEPSNDNSDLENWETGIRLNTLLWVLGELD